MTIAVGSPFTATDRSTLAWLLSTNHERRRLTSSVEQQPAVMDERAIVQIAAHRFRSGKRTMPLTPPASAARCRSARGQPGVADLCIHGRGHRGHGEYEEFQEADTRHGGLLDLGDEAATLGCYVPAEAAC